VALAVPENIVVSQVFKTLCFKAGPHIIEKLLLLWSTTLNYPFSPFTVLETILRLARI
jgi:hypothetical protein